MLDPRLYRAGLVPVLIALVIASFSLGNRPGPLTTTLAPDVFSGQDAMSILAGLVQQYPDRRPGSAADDALAEEVAHQFQNAQLTHVTTVHESARTIDGVRSLATVIGYRPGTTTGSIVLLAHRDAAAPGSEAELSGTAALLELAQGFGSTPTSGGAARVFQHTIVLVSTSGGSGGDGGAAGIAADLPGPVDAVIVLGDVAGAHAHRPFVLPYSDGANFAPQALQRTVTAALQTESGDAPGEPSLASQFAHLAVPMTVGEEGVLNGHGIPAVLLQVSGERGPGAKDPVDETRMQNVGRGALRAINALDSGPNTIAPPKAVLVIHGKVMPEWAIRLFVLALLLPPLLAGVDGLARAGRRREPVVARLLWALSCALPFLLTAVFAELLRGTGILSAAPSSPVPPGAIPVDGGVIAALAIVFVLAWLLRAGLLRYTVGWSTQPGGAGVVLTLLLVLASVVVWLFNPYAALLLVPATHLTLLTAIEDLSVPRPLALLVLLMGLLLPAGVLAIHAHELALSGGQTAWMLVLLVAGGYGGAIGLLLGSLVAGVILASLLLLLHPRPRQAAPDVTVRGPIGYAGPGSLGGTESALRR